jgi:hypothetical protein
MTKNNFHGGFIMSKYKVIKNIMESTRLNEADQTYYIEMYLKGWHTEEEIKWIWE